VLPRVLRLRPAVGFFRQLCERRETRWDYLQKQAGPAAFSSLAHCATCGAWQEISQRCPLCTALHMLPVRPRIEFVVLPVPSVVTELVTLDWLSSTTEPGLPDEVFDETVLASREMIVLDVSFDITLCARTLVERLNTANVTMSFMAVLQKVSQWR
jgi:hypothetical protein